MALAFLKNVDPAGSIETDFIYSLVKKLVATMFPRRERALVNLADEMVGEIAVALAH